jgi:hypothetical protein
MTVVIDGTNGITGVNGTAAAPAMTGTDTDTGVVYGTNTLSLATGGTTAVAVDASQNVGIGTSSPTGKLDVVGDQVLRGNFGMTTAGYVYSYAGGTNGQVRSGVQFDGTNQQTLFFTATNERMRIDSSGNLLVGQTATGTATGSTGMWAGSLTINPNLNTSSGSANVVWSTPSGLFYRSTSSIRYKENVENAVHGLQEVLQLRPVTYNGKSDIDGDKRFGGFIAEEVDAIGLTEFVVYDEENRPDSLGYDRMVSLCVKAIQEQQALIQDLTTRLAALEAK